MNYKFNFIICIFSLLFSKVSFSQENNVIFYNNSSKLLKCSIKDGNDYLPFVRLGPEDSKSFDLFIIGKEIRCSTVIDKNEGSSTTLTYFEVKDIGKYEFLQEYVSCPKCSGKNKNRYATIVVFPNGKPFYTKFSSID